MIQKLQDFKKTKDNPLVLSTNDEYYQKIKEDRKRNQEMNELLARIDRLEREVNALKELIRV